MLRGYGCRSFYRPSARAHDVQKTRGTHTNASGFEGTAIRRLELTIPKPEHHPMNSTSQLKALLFKTQPRPSEGRLVRFDENIPDISYATGSMRERVLNFLTDQKSFATASEISKGIGGNHSRTVKTLSTLVEEGQVESIKLNGSVREFRLTRIEQQRQCLTNKSNV